MWEMNISVDEDGDLASVSATWTDPTLGVFSYSRRSRVSVTSADAFIAEAIAERDIWQVATQNDITKSAWASDRINTADPKVVT